MGASEIVPGCNNGMGGSRFDENLVTFKNPKLPDLLQARGSKDAPQKLQFLGAINKVESLGHSDFVQIEKVVENSHRFGRLRSKIGLNPNVLAYSKIP